MKSDEFYIGWQSEMPRVFKRNILILLIILFSVITVLMYLISTRQKKFSDGIFEYDKKTYLQGVLNNDDFPLVQYVDEKTKSMKMALLVGYGKNGVKDLLNEFEIKNHVKINGSKIKISGNLITNNEKLILQINSSSDIQLIGPSNKSDKKLIEENALIEGEIIDPKCYFGVMKPGEGKVHKDCAIRCLLGGITPVFRVKENNGYSYYLLKSKNSKNVIADVKNFVADPITIRADIYTLNNWKILEADYSSIKHIN